MDAFAGQQRYLERIDAKERAQNLIVIGLSELAIDGATSDSDKLQMVFDEVSPGDAFDYTVRRLGEVRADGSTRPILVTLPSENKRNEILQNAYVLARTDNFKNVKLKRDQHPAIRKEWWRLFAAEQSEKQKPENAGCNIVLDKKLRQITKDGVIIDRFVAHF